VPLPFYPVLLCVLCVKDFPSIDAPTRNFPTDSEFMRLTPHSVHGALLDH